MRATSSSVLPIAAFSLLLLVPSVVSHGLVGYISVDGTKYTGNTLSQDSTPTQPSVIRRISTNDPVKGSSNPSLFCGMSATVASQNAAVNPGSQITLGWEQIGGGEWFHNVGPMMAYMASCGSTTCDQFDSTDAKWFKVSEQGLMPDGKTWYQATLQQGALPNVTIPSNIAPGNYLLRHEIINLALAVSEGGAEFYPSCSQLTVSGSGTGAPTASELVSFPGAYSDTDPGIKVDVYTDLTTYTFPGPAVASFISGSSSSPSSGSGSSSAAPSASAPASASPAPTSPTTAGAAPPATSATTKTAKTGKCTLKAAKRSVSVPPMHKKSVIPPRRSSRRAMPRQGSH